MRSWTLERFKNEFGVEVAATVMKYKDYRAIYPALQRDVRVVLVNGRYEAWETKLINSVSEQSIAIREES